MAEVDDHSLPNQMKSPVSNSKIQEHGNHANSSQNLCTLESAVAGSHITSANNNDILIQDGRLEQQSCVENVNHCTETSSNRNALANSLSEAIDLIGALRNHSRPNPCVNDGANKFGSSLELDLSLRRSQSDVLENKTTYEKQMLNHSNVSAFTRYVNKPLHISNTNSTSGPTLKGDNTNTEDSSLPYDRKVISLPINITKEVENEYQTASQRLFPIPFPVRGIRVDVCATRTGYGSTIPPPPPPPPPVVCTPSPSPSPSSTNEQMNSFHQFYHVIDQSLRISSNQSTNKQDLKLEYMEERAQFSPAADQSASSTLCNGTVGHQNGFGCGTIGESVGNVHQDAVVPGGSENGTEQSHVVDHGLNRQPSIQREAALRSCSD